MKASFNSFDMHAVLQELKQFLPVNTPLKDFTHQNSLRAFSQYSFYAGLQQASGIFGYKVLLSLEEYRSFFNKKRITADILEKVLLERKGAALAAEWRTKVLFGKYTDRIQPKIGQLRGTWKNEYGIDLPAHVSPKLFSILSAYLDQGIASWRFPVQADSFLNALREMELYSYASIFATKRAQTLLLDGQCEPEDLLKYLIGDPALYKQYLFDQQFAHPGWSGMVVQIQDRPEALLNPKSISLQELITFELLLEIDALDRKFGTKWQPLCSRVPDNQENLFAIQRPTELSEVLAIWQEAFEWSYYDQVLTALKSSKREPGSRKKSFQALFCMDDRECSLRRYVENFDSRSETFGTPGHFGLDFFYQPAKSNTHFKTCPDTVNPQFLIKEIAPRTENYSKPVKAGLWSKFRLGGSFLKPAVTQAAASSTEYMGRFSGLTIENENPADRENGLQIGFSVEEMAVRVEALLKSIGLVTGFAPVIYVIGHSASSVNNPHFVALDCCACAGRPGSVNARAFAFMANHAAVRAILRGRGIAIPSATQFVPALHDTTRDEITFFDEDILNDANRIDHRHHGVVFSQALDFNAKERSRRFEKIDKSLTAAKIHEQVRKRASSPLESRPELGHANNALCIIAKRSLTRNLFLDRRAFVNSYDHSLDPDGNELGKILKTLVPLCSDINLEYFFSRIDNRSFGAGSHSARQVTGLLGIEDSNSGDLRRGLPAELIETHDPVRLMFMIEQDPEIVKRVILYQKEIFSHFFNEWAHLVVVNPDNEELLVFKEGNFQPYKSYTQTIEDAIDLASLFESHSENLPVFTLH